MLYELRPHLKGFFFWPTVPRWSEGMVQSWFQLLLLLAVMFFSAVYSPLTTTKGWIGLMLCNNNSVNNTYINQKTSSSIYAISFCEFDIKLKGGTQWIKQTGYMLHKISDIKLLCRCCNPLPFHGYLKCDTASVTNIREKFLINLIIKKYVEPALHREIY